MFEKDTDLPELAPVLDLEEFLPLTALAGGRWLLAM
jgi:hypothetical protein